MQDVISRRVAALPAVLALTLPVLAGCGGDGGGDSVAEDRPEYANQEGEAGAEQFAGYWVEQINSATDTGKTKELASLGLKSCAACADFPRQLDEIYDAGGRVESEDWEIKDIVPEAGATDEQVGMLITVAVPPQQVYTTADAEPQEFPGGDQRFRMIVVRTDDHWMIQELTPR